MSSFNNMSPNDWLKAREIRRDLKWSIPIQHCRSSTKWPLLRVGSTELPAICATSTSNLGTKQSYLKLDAIVDIPYTQLRLFATSRPASDQPRICPQSYSSLMTMLGIEDEAHLYLGESQVSPFPQISQQLLGPEKMRSPLSSMDIPQLTNCNKQFMRTTAPSTSAESTMKFMLRASELFDVPRTFPRRHGGGSSKGALKETQQGRQNYTNPSFSLPTFRPSFDKVVLLRCRKSSTLTMPLRTAKTLPKAVYELKRVNSQIPKELVIVVNEIDSTIFDLFRLSLLDTRNQHFVAAIVSELELLPKSTTAEDNDFQEKASNSCGLEVYVAEVSETPKNMAVGPILLSGKVRWYPRTDEEAIETCRRVNEDIVRQRSDQGFDPVAETSIIVIFAGDDIYYVIVIDH